MISNLTLGFAPVGLAFSSGRRPKIVRTLRDAAVILLEDWPSDDGEEYVSAVKACMDAINGEIEPDEFKERLLHAAAEAGILALSVVQSPSHSSKETPILLGHMRT